MDRPPPSPSGPSAPPEHRLRGLIRTLLPILIVAALTRLSAAQDLFSALSRPIVVGILGLFHISGKDLGNSIVVGRLEIPWTGDCAGLNLLLLLLAVAIWVNRNERFGWRYLTKLLVMVPSAVAANVARIFTLVAYREINYPAIESPQLHYFFGLAWLVPFALLAMPRDPRPRSARLIELLHVAAVIALVAPLTDGPGGLGLTVAVILGLAHCHLAGRISKGLLVALGLWVLAAAAIALCGMESFWLPWLLVCPLVADPRWFFSPPGLVLAAAAHPLFALVPGAEILTWIAIAYTIWNSYLRAAPASPPPTGTTFPSFAGRILLIITSLFFLLPFLASTLIAGKMEIWQPPAEAETHPIPGNGFALRLPGQPDDLGLLWYESRGTERHHSVNVCLKYRGISLEPSKDSPDVFTDGTHWTREFFLQNGALIPTHLQYVISTLGPGTSAGVHLIFIAETSSSDAKTFNLRAQTVAADLFNRIRPTK